MQFEELFASFGTDVPFVVAMVLNTHEYWWLFPLLYFALVMLVLISEDVVLMYYGVTYKVCIAGIILAPSLFLITQIAMYYGVFFMGAGGADA